MNNKETHPLEKLCKNCNKLYLVRRESELKIRKYCSKKCQHESTKKEKIEKECEVCNKKFFVLPCLDRVKFCSRACKNISHRKIKDTSIRQCNKCKKILKICMFSGSREYICKNCRRILFKKRARSPRGRFVVSKHIAARRGLEWNMEELNYYKLIAQHCHYCEEKINETGVGLDRKDNSKGYTMDNVVTCCKDCNRTRSDHYTYEEMLMLAPTIKLIKEKRKHVI